MQMRQLNMKKPVHILLFFVLPIFNWGCSAGKASINEFQSPKTDLFKDYRIEYDKTITTDLTASGTLRIDKIGDYLILYDGHVSSLQLTCIDYTTGKALWHAKEEVRRYYFKDGLLVMQYDKAIELVEVPTGKSVFILNDCTIRWDHPEGSELGDQILVIYKDNDAVLDLKKKEIVAGYNSTRFATFIQQGKNGSIKTTGSFITDDYNLGEDFIAANIIENQEGKKNAFVWSLNKPSREFTLGIFDEANKKLKEHHWIIPKNKYKEEHDEYFTGLPEPDKLEPSTYVIGNKFFLFENYTRYRWSWGQGNNRLTCIDLNTLEMKYQVWGQSPEENEFHTFLFFNDIILQSNSTMHFQMGDGIYHRFNNESGKVLDSLPHRFTLFKEYVPGMMLGFNHHRELVKDNIYTNSVTVTLWDYLTNQYSKAFDFDFKDEFPYEPFVTSDGSIVFTYYDAKLGKSILYCCKVIVATN